MAFLVGTLLMAMLVTISNAQGSCQDKHGSCAGWGAAGECQANPVFMDDNCARTCNICAPRRTSSSCQDKHGSCAGWGAAGECQANPAFMNDNCARTCNICAPRRTSSISNCKFPFIYKGDTYLTCTKRDDPNGKLWCSIKTDNQNKHIKSPSNGPKNYRHCTSSGTNVQRLPSQRVRTDVIPSENECGTSLSNNVIGGEAAAEGEFPWLAALGKKIGARFSPFCGGTLISKQHVVSAAHCFNFEKTQDTTVRLGEHNVEIDGDGAQEYSIVNQRGGIYNNEKRKNDIILLKLDRSLRDFTDNIRAACLPYHLRHANFEGETLTVVGWGKFSNDPEIVRLTSPIPRKGRVPVVPLRECQSKYGSTHTLDGTQLCAGTGGTDSCRGDSGGPLNYLDPKKQRFYLVGLVSFGPRVCGINSRPGVYTRIGFFLDWIEDNIRQL